jgi:hypothetical protein
VLELLELRRVTSVAAEPAKLAKQRRQLLRQRRRWGVLGRPSPRRPATHGRCRIGRGRPVRRTPVTRSP